MRFDVTTDWYRQTLTFITILLLPFSWLFALIVAMRRQCYRRGIFKMQSVMARVIVVGNITVGGTGKTPFVIWLAQFLQTQGYRPGIISRGVGGKNHHKPHWVQASDAAKDVGDEAILLVKRTACPLVIATDRVAAAQSLLQHNDCNIIISDDGLQHYRLMRDLEIAIIDGERKLGNEQLLPAGPLREPRSRLNEVDLVIVNGDENQNENWMLLETSQLFSLSNPQKQINFRDFPRQKIHAVAAIGNPERFFASLRRAGFELITHVFPDHYIYQAKDLAFNDGLPVIMTEKDAVKCFSFAHEHYWYLPVTAKISPQCENILLTKLKLLEVGNEAEAEADFTKRSCHKSCDF